MTEKSKGLTIKGNFDLSAPSQMATMAVALKSHIVKYGLSTLIIGKQYVNVEGWAFAGGLMGFTPRMVKIEDISKGTEKRWRADVEIVRLKDMVVMGTGTAICSSAEGKKKGFDEYAICSQAQTRAIGRAYRNIIGWVIKMADYESTPAEEMVNMGNRPVIKEQPKYQPKTTVKPQTTAKPAISDLIRVKDKLTKLGARNAKEAIELYNEITGENIKSLAVEPARAKEMLFNILNSPMGRK